MGRCVNVALATAATALERTVAPVLFWLAVAVALASLLLIEHYNMRVTGLGKRPTLSSINSSCFMSITTLS